MNPVVECRAEPLLTIVTNPSKRRKGTFNPTLFPPTVMEWPHDPDSDEGSEGMRKYGMAILAKKVDEDDFPLSKDQFHEQVSDHPIRIDHETVVSVDDILDGVEADVFEDIQSFHRTVGSAMRNQDYWTYDPDEATSNG